MKKSKKIFVAVVLCVLVLFSAIPAFAIVFPGNDGDGDYQYRYAFAGPSGTDGPGLRTKVCEFKGGVYVEGSDNYALYVTPVSVDVWAETNCDINFYCISNTGSVSTITYSFSNRRITYGGVTASMIFIECPDIYILDQDLFEYLFIGDGQEFYRNGYNDGFEAGDDVGYNRGYSQGFSQGEASGYQNGYDAGFEEGASAEYSEGYQAAYDEYYPQIGASYTRGYNEGFAIGKAEGVELSETDFFDLCFAVAQAPIDVLYGVFDFEILGFNMQTAIGSLATVCIVVFLVKFLLFFLG